MKALLFVVDRQNVLFAISLAPPPTPYPEPQPYFRPASAACSVDMVLRSGSLELVHLKTVRIRRQALKRKRLR